MAAPQKVVTQPTRSADMDSAERATVPFGRETCGPLELAEQLECLVANGIGGFASGTKAAGAITKQLRFTFVNLPGATYIQGAMVQIAIQPAATASVL
jgi:hypothetical protein